MTRAIRKAARQLSLFTTGQDAEPQHEFSVRRSGRARRLSITVHPSGRVEVLAPKRASDRSVAGFVRENSAWIDETRAAYAQRYGTRSRALPTTLSMPALERVFPVDYLQAGGTTRIRESRGRLIVRGDIASRDAVISALRRWLSATARREFRSRLDALCDQTGLGYRRLQVRAQRTCWGSHSCSGTISLNYCALFVRPQVLRYLLIHELCHGRHMNHSRRYWSLVRSFEPAYRSLDRELSESWKMIPAWLDVS